MNLNDLMALLSGLKKAVPDTVEEAVDGINELIQEEFAKEQDPYGNAWRPLEKSTVKRKGFDRILFNTGALEANTRARAEGNSIVIETEDYAGFHQGDRTILPDTGELPGAWQEVIQKALEKVTS